MATVNLHDELRRRCEKVSDVPAEHHHLPPKHDPELASVDFSPQRRLRRVELIAHLRGALREQ
jgi:hypothetical protein